MAKIMLVEDDNNLRQIYEDRLAAEGYVIVSAKDGEEALALAVKERPDLIIADIMMPKVSGFDMLDILRSTPETKDAKIIMMTALSQAEDKVRAEKLGADKYLVKSQVTLEDVVDIANQMLTEQQAEASKASAGAVTTEPSVTAAPPLTAAIPVISAPPDPAPKNPIAPAPTPPTSPPTVTPANDTTPSSPTATPVDTSAGLNSTTPAKPTPDDTTDTNSSATPVPEAEATDKIDAFIASNPTLSSKADSGSATNQPTTVVEPVNSAKTTADSQPSTPTVIPVTIDETSSVKPTEVKVPAQVAAPTKDQSSDAMAAVDGLLKDTQGSESKPATSNDPTKPSADYVSDQSKSSEGESQSMSHTKRIEPIESVGTQAPSLNELLAQESDHSDPTPPPVNSVITPGGGSISPLPGSSVQDAISGGATSDETSSPDNITL